MKLTKNPKTNDMIENSFDYDVKFCLNCKDMELAKRNRNWKWKCLKCGKELEKEDPLS